MLIFLLRSNPMLATRQRIIYSLRGNHADKIDPDRDTKLWQDMGSPSQRAPGQQVTTDVRSRTALVFRPPLLIESLALALSLTDSSLPLSAFSLFPPAFFLGRPHGTTHDRDKDKQVRSPFRFGFGVKPNQKKTRRKFSAHHLIMRHDNAPRVPAGTCWSALGVWGGGKKGGCSCSEVIISHV